VQWELPDGIVPVHRTKTSFSIAKEKRRSNQPSEHAQYSAGKPGLFCASPQ